jgi:selenocysteine lyase/cysteine desulfurase
MTALAAYERELVTHLIQALQSTSGVHVTGITDPTRYHERVPTVVFTKDKTTPGAIATALAQQHIYVWDGNYYALEIMNRLGQSQHGMVRAGLAHYNTHAEIERFAAALSKL